MSRERLTVKKLYDKMEEIRLSLPDLTAPYSFGWWEAIAGFMVGASVGFVFARFF
jgi:hypothetical protein